MTPRGARGAGERKHWGTRAVRTFAELTVEHERKKNRWRGACRKAAVHKVMDRIGGEWFPNGQHGGSRRVNAGLTAG